MTSSFESAPPTLEEKLQRRPTTPGRGRRTLESLRTRRGYRVLSGTDARPERVCICPMDSITTWRRVSGDGASSMFEQEV